VITTAVGRVEKVKFLFLFFMSWTAARFCFFSVHVLTEKKESTQEKNYLS
jgi:hypothetical protein